MTCHDQLCSVDLSSASFTFPGRPGAAGALIPPSVPGHEEEAGDFSGKLAGHIRHGSDALHRRMVAWSSLLDAAGWCVAWCCSGYDAWIGPRAVEDLRDNKMEGMSWEGVLAAWPGIPLACRHLETAELRVWRSGEEEPAGALPVDLTRREREIYGWLRHGKTAREISVILGCAPRTVEKHLENLYRKMDVDGRTSALLGRKKS